MAAVQRQIGTESGAKFAPVPLAYERSLQERPGLDLWGSDGDHSSWAGLYLTACVLYATLPDRSLEGLIDRVTGTAPGDRKMSTDKKVTRRSYRGDNWEIPEE